MYESQRVSAIVTCAGKGVRFGGNKLLETLRGMTVIEKTVRQFVLPEIDEIIVTIDPDFEGEYRRILIEDAGLPVTLVHGAEERHLSAMKGLAATSGDLILVHDGVRPFVTAELIHAALAAGAEHGAAMLGLPSTVQVKQVSDDEFITGSLDRAHSWLGQTPQVFRRDLLDRAYQGALADEYQRVSDDADLVAEYTGHPVKIVLGNDNNIKITTPMDIFVAGKIADRVARAEA
ncbi:2-C-methyl-D-erythritol 4-phosphate cytidylyltransferase [Homoserinimonas sp. OAct 916]|uniref:IspD/TarI family cytidylyltransferase n=1 Tax=Homoserinimonas sp. OAct 916 TaxID=2211450 RepID=UPI000DBE7D7A|nr:IspD/TarI family cytidylyltransferase [Homoserinimonas sp. OAct 916]